MRNFTTKYNYSTQRFRKLIRDKNKLWRSQSISIKVGAVKSSLTMKTQ